MQGGRGERKERSKTKPAERITVRDHNRGPPKLPRSLCLGRRVGRRSD